MVVSRLKLVICSIFFFVLSFLFFGQSLSLAQCDPNNYSNNCPREASNETVKILYLDVKILEKNDNTKAIDYLGVQEDINIANEIWEQASIKFVLSNLTIIPEDGFWDMKMANRSDLENRLEQLFEKSGNNNVAHIYYVNEISFNSIPLGGITGVGGNCDTKKSGIAMSGYRKISNTLAHELGHLLFCHQHPDEDHKNVDECNIMRQANDINRRCITDEQASEARQYGNLQDEKWYGAVCGVVRDATGFIRDALTSLFNSSGERILTVETNNDGYFYMQAPVGGYYLRVAKDGYNSLRIPNTESLFFYVPRLTIEELLSQQCLGINMGTLWLNPCYDPSPIPLQLNQTKENEHICQGYYQQYQFDLTPDGKAHTITVTPTSGNPSLYYSDNQSRFSNIISSSWTDCANLYQCSSSTSGGDGQEETITFIAPNTGGASYPVYLAVYGETDVDYSVQVTSSNVSSMDFENGQDGAVIQSSIPGMYFTTTNNYDWIYGDWRTGNYNGSYPNGAYYSNGNFFAWLGQNQGYGKITFTGATTKLVSMATSSYSTVNLEAYDINDNLLDSDSMGGNLSTGTMNRLIVSAPNIAYVLVHDSGNYWLIDDLLVVDLLRVTEPQLPDGTEIALRVLETIDQSTTKTYLYDNSTLGIIRAILNWGGSEMKIAVYKPDGNLYGEYQSTQPPLNVEIPNAEVGQWVFEVAAVDVPNNNYPFALVAGTEAIVLGDLDGDGDVDRDDTTIILSHRNQPASACPDCDLDGDGTITVLDARKAILLCTRGRCATE